MKQKCNKERGEEAKRRKKEAEAEWFAKMGI